MVNIYIALLFGVPSFFRHAPMPPGATTLAIMRSCRQQAGGRLKGQGRPAGRQFQIEYRSTLIIRDFSRLFPYDTQLIIRIRYDTEQKEKTVRHRKTDSQQNARNRQPEQITARAGAEQETISAGRTKKTRRATCIQVCKFYISKRHNEI